MKQVFVVTVYNPFTESYDVVKVFGNKDEAILFCEEKNRNTYHNFYMEEAPFTE